MAIEDNLTWAHFGDALTQDFPTSGITRTNPGATGDPTVSSSTLVFDATSPGDSLKFTLASGEFFTGSTADFTVAWRGQIHTSTSNGNILIQIGDAGRYFEIMQKSAASLNLRGFLAGIGAETYTNANTFAVDTTFQVVFRRSSGVCSVWVDGSDDTASDGITTSDFNTTYEDLYLGSNNGSTIADCTMEFSAFWERALSDAEIGSLTEAQLVTALGGGGGGANPLNFGSLSLLGAGL